MATWKMEVSGDQKIMLYNIFYGEQNCGGDQKT